MLTTSLILAFTSLAFAQTEVLTLTVTQVVTLGTSVYTTTYGSTYAAPTSTSTPMTHRVDVGLNGTLSYNPTNISASVGDTVAYVFHPKNHTVTQSNFAQPCTPLANSTGRTGFNSGFMPTMNMSSDIVTFSILVNDTQPIWVYCAQTNPVRHCGMGMVMSINAATSGNMTFDNYRALALATNSTPSASPSGSGTPSGTASGATSSSTDDGTNFNGAISTSVNGLTAVLAVVGVALLAL